MNSEQRKELRERLSDSNQENSDIAAQELPGLLDDIDNLEAQLVELDGQHVDAYARWEQEKSALESRLLKLKLVEEGEGLFDRLLKNHSIHELHPIQALENTIRDMQRHIDGRDKTIERLTERLVRMSQNSLSAENSALRERVERLEKMVGSGQAAIASAIQALGG
jgi:cell division septum initiation protein DivIVA